MRITRSIAALVVSLQALAAAPGWAQTGDELRWRCAYDTVPGPGVACRLAQWPAPDSQAASLPDALDRLPPIMKRIRSAPETLADERIVIPLYAPPVDMRFVARLARAVMCGSRADCAVEFSSEPVED
jgi:hypothetical protein